MDTEPAPNPFAALGLRQPLVDGVLETGYDTPTPVQEKTIPTLLRGQDLLGQAQTGTGKTAAFGLPLLQRVDTKRAVVQGLVMAPTRELALQVAEALKGYGKHLDNVRVTAVYGGQPIHQQLSELRRGAHIVVGTPGRIEDVLERKALDLSNVGTVVLDEADEMLNMGFLEAVERIMGHLPADRQTALFSATMPPAIRKMAQSIMQEPETVTLKADERTVASIDQRFLVVPFHRKLDSLVRVLEAEEREIVLIFARTRAFCGELAESLTDRGFPAASLHGDLSQAQREDVMRQLRSGRVELVVATDVAARGLDVDGISHVINYDVPMGAEVYLHRIGRTGRAGKKGVSLLLLTPRERWVQRSVERYTSQSLTETHVPGNAEIAKRRTQRFEETVRAAAAADGLEPYRAIVEQLTADGTLDAATIAAAVAKLMTEKQPLVVNGPDPSEMAARETMARTATRTGTRPGRRDGSRPPREGAIRMFVSLGARAQLRPGDLVGALTAEAGIPGKAIGVIDIRESVSFFDIAGPYEKDVLSASGSLSIRGQKVRISRARPEGADAGRKSSGPPGRHRPQRHAGRSADR